MTSAEAQTFAVFFSVDYTNTREGDRMVLLRRLLREGLGADVTIIDDAMVTENRAYPFIVVAKATCLEALQTALKPCDGIYLVHIREATQIDFDPAAGTATHCVYVSHRPDAADTVLAAAPGTVSIRTHVELAPGAPCASVWFVRAPAGDDARRQVQSLRPGAIVATMNMTTGAAFYERKFSPQPAPAKARPAAARTMFDGGSLDFAITNEGPAPVYLTFYGDSSGIFAANPSYQLMPNATVNLAQNACVYSALPGTGTYNLSIVTIIPGMDSGYHNVPSRFPVPALTIPYAKGGHVGFDLTKPGSERVISNLADWLSDLVLSSKFDVPWPEDGYTGDYKDAYDYIVSQLPSKPKDGFLSSAELDKVSYPAGKSFSQAVFKEVWNHLLDECIYFNDVQQWYGTGGVFDAINTKVVTTFGPALTAAAGLMSIPPQQSIVVEVLDAVLTSIAALVALVPACGPAISAAIRVGWSIAKVVIDTTEPKASDTPIVSTVANLADVMANYLNQQTVAVATQYGTIRKNWGRLKEFGLAKETGKISEQVFEVSIGSNGTVRLSDSYVKAASDAWSIVIYKSLFAVSNTATARMTFASDPQGFPSSQNPWKPASGNYNYRYAMGCVYFNGTGDPTHLGLAVIDCQTGAPLQVMQKLFGPSPDALNVDPVEFFCGYNGWPPVVPLLYSFDIPDANTTVPIIKFDYTL